MKVFVTVPCQPHWMHKSVAHVLLKIQREDRFPVVISMPSNKPLENNQHHIVREFLDGDYTHWFTIDADNPPVGPNPLDLVLADKDIIGLPTPVYHSPEKKGERFIYFNCYDWDEKAEAYREHLISSGWNRVHAIGGGCMLIARRVFENPVMEKAPFRRTMDQYGRVVVGNDLSFSQRAIKQGFKIWVHSDYQCDHFCEVSLREVLRLSHEMAFEGRQ